MLHHGQQVECFERTRAAIATHVVRTPCIDLDGIALKREDLQTSGSFKWRGVQAQLRTAAEPPTGLVCVSTGNTGKAVARATAELAIPAHIFCAQRPRPDKHDYIRRNRGTVHIVGASFSAASVAAQTYATDHGMAFCSPGASWQFALGAGGIATEILEEDPDTSVIFTPIGGGGLAAGLGVALKAWNGKRPRLIGVQAANSPYVYDLFYGREDPTAERPTIADCLAGDLEPDAVILVGLHEMLESVVLVSDDELRAGARQLAAVGVDVEPGAAAAFVAARASFGDARRSEHVCAIVSGSALHEIPTGRANGR